MITLPPSRLPGVGTTIFTVMSALAAEQQAINLSQGFPDFPADPDLLNHLTQAVLSHKNQYAPMAGLARLREGIAALTERKYGRKTNPDLEVTITSGATEALFDAIAALVRPGDEVILLTPAYDSYGPAVLLNGGKPVYVPLSFPNYRPDWEQIRRAITPATRAILINSPHNPTGAIFHENDIQELKRLVEDFPIWIISDEVYEHIVFDGQDHLSVSRYPELSERAFVVSSFGKTFHVTGWKTGYCVAPASMTEEFRKIHQFNTFCSPAPLQEALADILDTPRKVDELSGFYQQKRDTFLSLMQGSKFRPLPSQGTYFQLMDYSEISREKDTEFCKWLTIEMKVAAIPVSVFYPDETDHKVIRFCFAKQEETLKAAAERLCKI